MGGRFHCKLRSAHYSSCFALPCICSFATDRNQVPWPNNFIAVFITCGLLGIRNEINSLPLIIRKLKCGCLRYLGVVSDVSSTTAVFSYRRCLSPYTSSRIDPDTVRVQRQRWELPDRADCVISWNKFQNIRWHSAFDGLFSAFTCLINQISIPEWDYTEPNRVRNVFFGRYRNAGQNI